MNDKDLITIGYDIIRDINNPDMLYFYEKLLKDNKIKYSGNKEVINENNISDIFDVKATIKDIDNKKFIYIEGGDKYEKQM